MRIFTFLLILFLAFSGTAIGNTEDSLLKAERDYYFKEYRSVRDTMTINTWLNLKRLSDNLEQVVQRDQIIIDQYLNKAGSDTILSEKDSLELKAMANLEMQMEQLESRTMNDMRMLWILKTAAGLMLFIILLLLYLLINGKSKLNRLMNLYAFADKLSVEKRKENTMLESELEKLRQREQDFRAELEKGLISHQEKLMLLQKKNIHLESELKKVKEQRPGKEDISLPLSVIKSEISNLPDDEKGVQELIHSLSDERNSLMNLAGRLQQQLKAEKEKYNELMQKIKSITGVNPDENNGDGMET